eukprot:Amastigsp_a174760_125.p5 type:complete len:142 gc:universal Amastigsp_a174760_125:445-20(-)
MADALYAATPARNAAAMSPGVAPTKRDSAVAVTPLKVTPAEVTGATVVVPARTTRSSVAERDSTSSSSLAASARRASASARASATKHCARMATLTTKGAWTMVCKRRESFPRPSRKPRKEQALNKGSLGGRRKVRARPARA